jgi:hypothetical protein
MVLALRIFGQPFPIYVKTSEVFAFQIPDRIFRVSPAG